MLVASRKMGDMTSSYSQIPATPFLGWVSRIFHKVNKATVSGLPPLDPELLAVLQNRGDAGAMLDTPKTMAAVGRLARHHPHTCPAYWAIRLLLEWNFGRLQVHQLISHKVLDVKGWVDSTHANEAGAALRVVSLPQVLIEATSPMAEALDYKLYGFWSSQLSGAVPTMPDAQGLLNTDAAVNFWLPDSVMNAADALGQELELSRSDVIRNILFLHLYGRVFYEDCLAQENWKTRWRDAGHFDDAIMFSRSTPSKTDHVSDGQPKSPEPAPRTAYITTYGKSVKSIKVWLPSVMREHLEQINESKNNTLAETLRSVLTTDLLGQGNSNEVG